MHRARPASTPWTQDDKKEDDDNMESYRKQIDKMLDTIEDAALMRMIYSVIHAILMNR